MDELRNEYIQNKCKKCENKKLSIKENKCDIRVFQHNGCLYCKCSNCSDTNNEIKRELV